MKLQTTLHTIILSAIMMISALQASAAPTRIVALGDSITDGETYQLLMRQSLYEAGRVVPQIINAGVASDTAVMMGARLERDVLPFHPDLVLMMAGTNDSIRNVTPQQYETEVTAIAEKLRAANVPMIFITPPIYGEKHAAAQTVLVEYSKILQRLAKQYEYRLADFYAASQNAQAAGAGVLGADGVHLSFEGYRVMTRVVLDALEYSDVAVPQQLRATFLPGVISEWKVRVAPDETPLDEKSVAQLKPNEEWKPLSLPQNEAPTEAERADNDWWMQQERARGFASLKPLLGAAKKYQGVAVMKTETPREVYFNTGAQLESVWLNGQRIYKNESWTGWHPGKERIAAKLQTGHNTIVIESGEVFFLSVTRSKP